MLPWCQFARQIIYLRHRDVVAFPYFHTIDIDSGGFGSFEEECYSLVLPCSGNVDTLRIRGFAKPCEVAREMSCLVALVVGVPLTVSVGSSRQMHCLFPQHPLSAEVNLCRLGARQSRRCHKQCGDK